MDDRVSVDSIDAPRLGRRDEDSELSDYQGWLHAPVAWTHERDLEKRWKRKHSSRLGVGLAVAGNPRRHFLVCNVRHDSDWVRSELETLIAEVENTPDAGPAQTTASVGPIEPTSEQESGPTPAAE